MAGWDRAAADIQKQLLSAPSSRRVAGFSLIEVLVAIAVFAVVAVSAGGVMAQLQQSWQRQRDAADVQRNAYWAADVIINEMRLANAATVTVNPGGDSVQFRVDPDGDGNPPYLQIEYQMQGAVLRRREIPGSGFEELADFIADPNVFSWNAGRVSIALNMMKGNITYTLISQVRPRN